MRIAIDQRSAPEQLRQIFDWRGATNNIISKPVPGARSLSMTLASMQHRRPARVTGASDRAQPWRTL